MKRRSHISSISSISSISISSISSISSNSIIGISYQHFDFKPFLMDIDI